MNTVMSMEALDQSISTALGRLPIPSHFYLSKAQAAPEQSPLEVDLGDGSTFADLMGCGIAIVEQVDRSTGQAHRVVLTRDNLERLLTALS